MGLFLMRQSISTMPDSVIEAAKVDGAGLFRICWQIVIPNQKPALMTLIIFAFQAAWNIQSGSLVFKEEYKTLPTVVSQAAASGIAKAGVAMASKLWLIRESRSDGMKKFFSKLTAALSAAVMIFTAVPIDTSAEQPYDSYNYDRWGDAIPSQAGYTTERTVSGYDLDIGAFSSPSDIFISADRTFYIADKDNDRIVAVNEELTEVSAVYDSFTMPDHRCMRICGKRQYVHCRYRKFTYPYC